MARNNPRGMATSAIWKNTYRERRRRTSKERLLFTHAASGKRVGASFGTVSGSPTFSASLVGSTDVNNLQTLLGAGKQVLGAWDLPVAGYPSNASLAVVEVPLKLDVFPPTIKASHHYLNDPPANGTDYAITITITDKDGGSYTRTTGVTVQNADPVIASAMLTKPQSMVEGDTVTLNAAFTDAGVLDAHTATVKWGDGSALQTLDLTESNGAGTIAATTHQYLDDEKQVFAVMPGQGLRIIAASTPTGDYDYVFATGDPALPENHVLEAATGGAAVTLYKLTTGGSPPVIRSCLNRPTMSRCPFRSTRLRLVRR